MEFGALIIIAMLLALALVAYGLRAEKTKQ
jgi:hypothetical protein